MLTVKLVYKLSNVPDDLKWAKNTHLTPERSGSGVELRTLDYENPGSNPSRGVKTLGKCFHSTLLQFTQLNK